MKSSLQLKLRWGEVEVICLCGGLLIINQFNPQLWIETFKLYNLLRDPHQLEEIISSFGTYAPITLLTLFGVSLLVALVLYIYHEEIHGWIKNSKEMER